MSADPATLAAISGLLKEDYLPAIRNQFTYRRVLDQLLENNTEDVAGTHAVMAVRLSGNAGIGFRGDNVALPAAGHQNVVQVQVPMRRLYGRVQFTGAAIAASRKNSAAFAKVMSDEMENLVKDLRKVNNVYHYGDGSGALCRVASVTDANNIVVDRWSKLFVVGRVLDSYTDKTGATQNMNSKTITAVSKSTLTLTITGHSAVAGDYIYLEDSINQAQMGLMGVVDDGNLVETLQGLSRTTYPIWKAKVLGNGGTARDISEDIILDTVSLQEEEESEPDLLVGTVFQRNDLIKELGAKRQFVNTDVQMKLKGGIRAVEICDMPFTWDVDAPAGYCFVLNSKAIQFFMSAPLDWMQEDGSVLFRVANYDAYEATLFQYREMGTERCNIHARIEDLNENRPAGY